MKMRSVPVEARIAETGPEALPRSRGGRLAVELGLVVLISLALRGLTSPAQAWLPNALRPFANSASGWTLLTALGCGVLAGVGLGEAVFGLTVMEATTGCFYWTFIGMLGVLLVTVVTIRQLRAARDRVLAAGTTIAVAAAFLLAYNIFG